MSKDASRIQDLVDWAREYQTSLHPDVEVYQDPLTGLSFRATKSLPPATKIANSSFQTTLSYLNAISADVVFKNHESVPFPSKFIEALKQDDANVIGHFFLVQQFLMGEKSFWSLYIKLLPQPDEPERLPIPIWWPEADRKFLEGTNAEPPIKKREEIWRAEWAKGAAQLRDGFENWEEYTYPLYKWAATIFGSRSFRASLTIPEELMEQLQTSRGDLSLTLDHIKKDRFSVLLPLLDIGNHDGANQVDWLPDSVAGRFNISIRGAISKGSQIFNFYGHKSNSELLVAYGFILPNPENDKVNLKLTPSADAMQLRRSQLCHVIRDHTQPEQEFMFDVKTRSGESGIQDTLKSFSEGLIDTLVCMVANARERKFIIESPGYCVEKGPDPFGNPLSRAFIQAMSILFEKLEYEMKRIEKSEAKLGEPHNQNQRLALEYRRGQLRVLKGAHASVSEYIQHSISFNHICPHANSGSKPSEKANFLSLECAFGWLRKDYEREYNAVTKLISQDQEEPLPLNWAVIVEDWDNTYWIVWILLLWMLWLKNPGDFEMRYIGSLWRWQSEWYSAFQPENKKGGSYLTRILHADASEEATIDQTIEGIIRLPGLSFGWGPLQDMKFRTEIRNYISYLVQEETVLLPYTMQHLPQKGTQVPQRMLYMPLYYSDECSRNSHSAR